MPSDFFKVSSNCCDTVPGYYSRSVGPGRSRRSTRPGCPRWTFLLKDAFTFLRGGDIRGTHYLESRKHVQMHFAIPHAPDAGLFCYRTWEAVLKGEADEYKEAGQCETLHLLKTCDGLLGTSHAAHMRSIFLRVCTLLCKADGVLTEQEGSTLADIEMFLDGRGIRKRSGRAARCRNAIKTMRTPISYSPPSTPSQALPPLKARWTTSWLF